MNTLKKVGIIGGGVIGGVIGGALSVAGKVAKVKLIEDVGESIIDSSLLTGAIVGDIASGASDVVTGKIKNEPQKIKSGVEDLKAGGGTVLNNVVNNFQLVAENGGEIAAGIKEKDSKKMSHGVKNLAKVMAVGVITVGAIKIKDDDENSETK